MSIVELTHGAVSTSGSGTMNVDAYYMRKADAAEQVLFDAEKDTKSGINIISPAEVIPSGSFSTGKKWITTRNEYPEGSYIKILISSTSMIRGVPQFDKSLIILRSREGAALQQISVKLPTDPKAAMSFLYVTGRFDILTPDEAVALKLDKLGLIRKSQVGIIDPVDEATLFTVSVKERGVAPPVPEKLRTVVSASGVKQAVPRLRRKRLIRLPG